MTGPHVADPPRYRTIYDHIAPDKPVGIVLDEVGPLAPDRADMLRGAIAQLTPVTHLGRHPYDRDPLHHPEAEWYQDDNGDQYPTAVWLAPWLHRPGVTTLAVTPKLPTMIYLRSMLFGLAANGLLVSAVAPLAYETTHARLP